jgi:beta-galactosidase
MPWSWSTAVASWTWEGDEGRETTVEVYSATEEVELWKDGTLVGRQPAGPAHSFQARFVTTYEPGELVAVSFTGGRETGRAALRTAVGAPRLSVTLDRGELTADHRDLGFLAIELVDQAGTIHPCVDRDVSVRVDGAARLQGLGSAAPSSDESFLADRCRTYCGRAVAVVRPTSTGAFTVTVTADGCEPVSVDGLVVASEHRPWS